MDAVALNPQAEASLLHPGEQPTHSHSPQRLHTTLHQASKPAPTLEGT